MHSTEATGRALVSAALILAIVLVWIAATRHTATLAGMVGQ